MTYEDCLNELDKQDLKNEFCLIFENIFSIELLERFKNTDKIHSVGSLIRTSLSYIENNSEIWNRWVLVLQWYMHPEFVRPEKITDWIKQKQ